jgi:hypothetical protein
LLLVGVLLAGCGAGNSAARQSAPISAAPHPPNPCALLSIQEVAATLGNTIAHEMNQVDGNYTACVYSSGGPGVSTVTVLVRPMSEAQFRDANSVQSTAATSAHGQGGPAYMANSSTTPVIWKNGVEVIVLAQSEAAPKGDLPAEKQLASSALEHL